MLAVTETLSEIAELPARSVAIARSKYEPLGQPEVSTEAENGASAALAICVQALVPATARSYTTDATPDPASVASADSVTVPASGAVLGGFIVTAAACCR